MALSSYPTPTIIEDSSLTDWKVIGSGGFGQIYKARHLKWCCDVAIKLLHYDDGSSTSLLREIDMMRQGSSPYVIQVLGVFKGRLPLSGPSAHLGLVMEVMERGSLASLQDTLGGTPPLPVVFRLAHQVALGINFLHSLSPALLHLDLKPSNVLLDSYLNAKLTDFGLARLYHSITRASKRDSEGEGGTISYMPPEAFDISYIPTKASDIYSYGILLWSIVTGKQPYAQSCVIFRMMTYDARVGGIHALSGIVRLRIPQGDRPSLEDIRSQAAGRAGLTGLMDLMERCWKAKPDQRPSSHECTTVTEELYKIHKHAIVDAVHAVLKKLDEKEEESLRAQVERVHITQASVKTRVEAVNNCDNVPTRGPPVQEMAGGWFANQRDKARIKDLTSTRPANACDVDEKVKVSSVYPIQSPPRFHSTERLPQGQAAQTAQRAFRQHLFTQYQRQLSSPETFPYHPPPAAGGLTIYSSHVTGVQYGGYNTMHIYADPMERKRHPTAPSSVNVPLPLSGSRRDKTGGVG